MLSKEEFLKPRYKVIERWPNMGDQEHFVGEIIQLDSKEKNQWFTQTGGYNKVYDAYFDSFPHLFKKLEWWEEREESDMPEYVKFVRNYHHTKKGEIKKVLKYLGNGFYTGKTESYLLSDKDLLPATREEYEQFLSLINKTK